MRFQEKRFSVASTTPDAKPEDCAHTTVIRVRAKNLLVSPMATLEEFNSGAPIPPIPLLGECWHCKAKLQNDHDARGWRPLT